MAIVQKIQRASRAGSSAQMTVRHKWHGMMSRTRTKGFAMVESLVSALIGTFILYATLSSVSLAYRASTTSETQVIATNMAQQIIDNARNCTYGDLNVLVNGTAASTSVGTASQQLDLYGYTSTFFPRPLLQNQQESATTAAPAFGATYSTAAQLHAFPKSGSVTETLKTVNGYDPVNLTGAIQVGVLVSWNDGRGKHSYSTSTLISQSGIHNY